MLHRGIRWVLLAAMAATGVALTPDAGWARGGRGWGGGWVRGGGRGGVYIGIGRGGFYGGYGRGYYGRGIYGGRRYYGGYYGGGYYPSYGYGGGYYSYPAYSSGSVIYSTPTYSSPVVTRNVPSNPPALRSGSGGDVVIENTAENGAALNYSLNGNDYTIQPGQTQRIADDRQWVIEFDRGDGAGTARYTLSEGRFKFKSTNNGWDLVRSANQTAAAPDNTAKPPLPDPSLQSESKTLEPAPRPQP